MRLKLKNHGVTHRFPGPQSTPKIVISHIFVFSRGNISKDKAQQIFLLSFPGRVSVIFHWISAGLCNSSFIEELLNIKNKKWNIVLFFFFKVSWTNLGKKFFTAWNVPNSEVYMTCFDFWKFHDDLKACLEVIRLPGWSAYAKFSVKMQIFYISFWSPEKFIFELMTNLKFSFCESTPGSVYIPPKPIFLFKFVNF